VTVSLGAVVAATDTCSVRESGTEAGRLRLEASATGVTFGFRRRRFSSSLEKGHVA